MEFNKLAADLPADIIAPPETSLTPGKEFPIDLDSDLDDLLAESVAAVAAKKPATNRRIYKETKKLVDGILADQATQKWEILENISVWTMTKCSCGGLGVITFNRYMQKSKQVGSKTLNWGTVEELEPELKTRKALITREVNGCEFCKELAYEKFEEFQEVIR